jgi:catechol 2,3-dioxygenase-like lactoylglutathione lyase family enzyme
MKAQKSRTVARQLHLLNCADAARRITLTANRPTVGGVLETALYVDDISRSREFYQRLFGFEVLFADDRLCALSVAAKQVLLLFKKGASTKPIITPGGTIPPNDGDGQMHFAFAISAADVPAWEEWLATQGVKVESKVHWERGGQSLYFTDPDGHLGELASPGIWAIY